MEIKLLTNENIEEIKDLYDDIRNTTYTLWDNNYPDEELIRWDIERKGLWGLFDGKKLVGITFIGKRCEDGEEGLYEKLKDKKFKEYLGVYQEKTDESVDRINKTTYRVITYVIQNS